MAVSSKVTYAEIARKIRELPLEKSTPTHEWEELVHKLFASNDADLHDIGALEMEKLQHHQ